MALFYLRAVQGLEQRNGYSDVDAGSTLSNICAVFSEMGRHEEALREITMGIGKLENANKVNPTRLNAVNLIVGYHNYAIECEYLGKFEKGLKMIEKGLAEAKKEQLAEDLEIIERLVQTRERMEEKKDKL